MLVQLAPAALLLCRELPHLPHRARGILIVDDDEMIRTLLGEFFRSREIPVWLASDGEEAIELFAQLDLDIGLVLLDVRMPEMDGPQTLRKLQVIRRDVPCYFMTGD